MPRISMSPADREKYGGPEWYELESSEILDEETGVIEQIEERWGLSPAEFLGGLSRGKLKAIRALIWAARWKQGTREDANTFRPSTQEWSGVRIEVTAKEAALRAELEARAAPPPLANRRKAAPRKKNTAALRTSSTGTGSGSSGS